MKMRSVMQHAFSQVPKVEIPRSSFDRSHGYKTTFDSQYLVPIFLDEALPGDTFNLRMHGFARLATPLFPIMDNMFMETFFFAVPYRLLWENWERFNGAQDDPEDSTDFMIPTMTVPAGGFDQLSFPDYVGLPIGVEDMEVSALPWRAYCLIYNEWFRDQNLQDSVAFSTGDGPDNVGPANLFLRGKRHDYFTSCLPWPQKGDSVELPLGQFAPVVNSANFGLGTGRPSFRDNEDSVHGLVGGSSDPNVATWSGGFDVSPDMGTPFEWGNPGLAADLTDATAATINQLRQAFQVQKLLERDARGGTRYTEIVRSHFGVISPDARLQRPEYLGGGSTAVNISPVAQTSQTTTTGDPSPQGNLAAFGTASLNGHGFSKSFTEHCLVIGLVNVRADLTYQYGINRMWSRQTRYDFYWPALAHIGEQAVLSKEIYADGTAGDETVFGYQERYAEYRYKPSMVTGLFRSNAVGTLDAWHLAEEFDTRPVLNENFIVPDPETLARAVAVPSEPQFLFDSYFSLRCARPMPMFGVPGFIDQF